MSDLDDIFVGGGAIPTYINQDLDKDPVFYINGEQVMERRHEAHTQDNYTKVKTSDLLAKLKENRTSHQQEWEEAHGKWRGLQTEKLEDFLTAVQAAIDTARGGGKIEFPQQHDFTLDEPHSHAKEYDKVIARMEMTVDETIHISHKDFDRYVLDDWSWKREFAATASLYNG